MLAREEERPSTKFDPKLSRYDQLKIGHRLRESYQQLVDEPLPPRLLDLMKRLEGGK